MAAQIASTLQVPVIDLTTLDTGALLADLHKTCTASGFFYVTGHGVAQELVDETFDANRRLFAMPLEEKQKMLAGKSKRGWTPFGGEWLNPSNQQLGDTKEGWYMGRDFSPSSQEAPKVHGPNQWPDEALVPGYRGTLEAYMLAMHTLGTRLLRLLALSLGLDEGSFAHPMLFLRPLHYEGRVSVPSQGVFAAGAHSDYGIMTILATDDEGGLEFHMPDSGWAAVPPKRGCFIINVGDMLERWSDGVYRSRQHRVVNSTGRERYSIACFF